MDGDAGYQSFVKIGEENNDDIMELPREKEGTLLLSTIQAQFPSAIGLKYKSSSGGWRGIRAVENVLDPPFGGWGETTYFITQSDALKRKSTSQESNGNGVKSKKSTSLLQDIAVFGLPYTTTDDEFKEYFTNSCGEVAFHEIKYNRETNKSRGFGFIRFKTQEGASEALNGNHELKGRRLEVRVSRKKENPMKLFIGRLPRGATEEEVREYFGEFGEMDDVFVPSPARGFAFITFASQEVGNTVLRMSHILQGARLNVTVAEPKEDKSQSRGNTDFEHSDYSWKPSGNRTNEHSNDRYNDRNNERNSNRNEHRNGSSQNNNSRYEKNTSSYEQDGRYQSNTSQESAPKDVASELKSMLFALLSNQQ